MALDPDLSYEALVTEVNDSVGYTSVDLGVAKGTIPIDVMKWARQPNPDKYWEYDLIQRPSQALKVGDVVLVRQLDADRTFERKKGQELPKDHAFYGLVQEPQVQGALISMDPRNGAIRAMVGGYDYRKSEFNRAIQALRQPGSAFKPLIYSTALDRNYTAASMIVDAPIVYDDPTRDFSWKPKNFTGKFYGDTIFRECLIKSRNIPTVKIVQDIGVGEVIDRARLFGITSPMTKDFSLALGSSAVRPVEIVSAYATFATGGKHVTPIFIKKVIDRNGTVLEDSNLENPFKTLDQQVELEEQESKAQQVHYSAIAAGKAKSPLPDGYVISPQNAFVMTHLMKQVISSGTGRRASGINRPAAGKTGTTNDNFDAWFIGYTPTLVSGVWIGEDQAARLGVREVGGSAASPIWLSYMSDSLQETPVTDFEVPDGVVFAQIDAKTGKLATKNTQNPVFEAFYEGTQPQETTDEAEKKKTPQQFFLDE